MVLHAQEVSVLAEHRQNGRGSRTVMQLHSNHPMKRAGEAGKALRAGGGADFIFSASERVVKALSLPVEALVCLRGVLCCGERVRA
jgi:hypothetical protein